MCMIGHHDPRSPHIYPRLTPPARAVNPFVAAASNAYLSRPSSIAYTVRARDIHHTVDDPGSPAAVVCSADEHPFGTGGPIVFYLRQRSVAASLSARCNSASRSATHDAERSRSSQPMNLVVQAAEYRWRPREHESFGGRARIAISIYRSEPRVDEAPEVAENRARPRTEVGDAGCRPLVTLAMTLASRRAVSRGRAPQRRSLARPVAVLPWHPRIGSRRQAQVGGARG